MSNVKYFTNDKFRTLAYLYDVKGNDNRARITQQEVADELGLSRVTMNGIFKQLKEDGYYLVVLQSLPNISVKHQCFFLCPFCQHKGQSSYHQRRYILL